MDNYTLYELNGEFQNCLESAIDQETGEIKNNELLPLLNNLQIALAEKAQNIVYVLTALANRTEAIEKEITRLQTRKKIADNNYKALKEYLANNIPQGQIIETDLMKISWRKSESVEITDITKLPHEYLTVKVDEKPNKDAIKAAIKAGKEVPGAELNQKQNIQIK